MHTRAAVAVFDAEASNKIVTAKVTSDRSIAMPGLVQLLMQLTPTYPVAAIGFPRDRNLRDFASNLKANTHRGTQCSAAEQPATS